MLHFNHFRCALKKNTSPVYSSSISSNRNFVVHSEWFICAPRCIVPLIWIELAYISQFLHTNSTQTVDMHLALLLTIGYMRHLHSLRYNNDSINTTPVNVYDNIHARVRNDKLIHIYTPCAHLVREPAVKKKDKTLFFPFSFIFSLAIIMKNELKWKNSFWNYSQYITSNELCVSFMYLFIALHNVRA